MLQGLAMALLEQGSSGSSLESSPAASAQGAAAEVLLGPGPSFGGSLVKYFGKRRGGLYCVLQCEGQTKHTAMVAGSRPRLEAGALLQERADLIRPPGGAASSTCRYDASGSCTARCIACKVLQACNAAFSGERSASS